MITFLSTSDTRLRYRSRKILSSMCCHRLSLARQKDRRSSTTTCLRTAHRPPSRRSLTCALQESQCLPRRHLRSIAHLCTTASGLLPRSRPTAPVFRAQAEHRQEIDMSIYQRRLCQTLHRTANCSRRHRSEQVLPQTNKS